MDGVDDDNVGLHVLEMLQDFLRVGLSEDEAVGVVDADALGTHLDLGLAFLAGDIKHLTASQLQGRLQE